MKTANSNMFTALIGAIGIGIGTLAMAAPAAQADGLAGVSGWQPSPDVCGGQNQIPILVTNLSQTSQTGSITVNDSLAANFQVYGSYQGMLLNSPNACQDTINAGQGYTYNFTVQPGTTQVYWAAIGGIDSNDDEGSPDAAIGGLPGGTPGASWYDFDVVLSTMLGFKAMQVQYNNTGGTDTPTSKQNNFNVVPCVTDGNGNVNVGYGTLTPYRSGQATGPTYQSGQPVCLGWYPEGVMSTAVSTGALDTNILAVQGNFLGGDFDTIDFAGTYGATPIDNFSYATSVNGVVGPQVSIPFQTNTYGVDTTATFAFIDGGTWGVMNIPTPPLANGTLDLFMNGVQIGSTQFVNQGS